VIYGSHDLIPIWALLIIWLGGKCKYIIPFPPLIEKVTSAVDAYVGTCHLRV